MPYQKHLHNFKDSFINGIGWSLGATVGFALISTVIVSLLSYANTLPVVGSFIAEIVKATQVALARKY